jgi:Immunity protein family (Imm11)
LIYGLLDHKNADEESYCFIDSWPKGKGFDPSDAAAASTGDPVADIWPQDARADMSSKFGGMVLADFVSNTLRLLIVHERVKDVIERINSGKTEFLPLSIFNHKHRLASKEYFVVNPLGTHDVLDLDASDIKWSGKDVVRVKKFVLDPAKMKRAPDLFRPREAPGSYFISKRIATTLQKLDPPNTNRNYLDIFDVPDQP